MMKMGSQYKHLQLSVKNLLRFVTNFQLQKKQWLKDLNKGDFVSESSKLNL